MTLSATDSCLVRSRGVLRQAAGMVCVAAVLGCRASAGDPAPAEPRLPTCAAIDRSVNDATIPFGIYSVPPSSFAELRASGFTMVGPWYAPAPDRALLDAASDAGLGVVFPLGDPKLRIDVAEQLAAVVDHAAIVAWYLLPDELRAWRDDELAWLQASIATIRAGDPRGRPIVGYQPNDRSAAQLDPIVDVFDIAAKGAYVGYAGHRDRRAWVRWSAAELRAAAGPGKPAWLLPEMFEDPIGAGAIDIDAWVHHDVYAGLLSGADGVLVYSGAPRKGFTTHDDYLAAYREVADELNGARALGRVLHRANRCRARTLEQLDGPRDVDVTAVGDRQRIPSVLHVELADEGARWTWLVNSAASPIVVRLSPPLHGEIVLGAERTQQVDDRVWLAPWAVLAVRE
jgi:hypothetical protein